MARNDPQLATLHFFHLLLLKNIVNVQDLPAKTEVLQIPQL
jgi:hypothetical protein